MICLYLQCSLFKYHGIDCHGLSGHSTENRCWVPRWVSQPDSVPSQGVLLTLLSQLDLGCHCGGVCCARQLCFHSSTTWPAATTQWGHEHGHLAGHFCQKYPQKGEGPSPLWPQPVLVHCCTPGAQVVSPRVAWPGTTSAKTRRHQFQYVPFLQKVYKCLMKERRVNPVW